MKTVTALLAVVCMTALAGCASQDEIYAVDDRLATLERQSASQDADEHTVRSQSAELRAEMDTLRQDLQRMNGRLEETVYQLNLKIDALVEAERKRQMDAATAADNRVSIERIEHYLSLEKSPSPSRPDTVAPAVPPPAAASGKITDDRLYATAKQALDKGDYPAARTDFSELIRLYPKSNHADNAQFWIGDSYYREQWYEKAILEYQKVIENYPNGNKVQAALLKQGFSFLNLQDTANARLILKELVRKYPDSNEAGIARKKLEGLD